MAGTVGKALGAGLPAGVVAAIFGEGALALILIGIGAVGAVVGVVADARVKAFEQRDAARREQEDRLQAETRAQRERLGLLATTVWGVREHIPQLAELAPYDLGVDREAISVEDGSHSAPYVPRERDEQLRQTLTEARERSEPSLIVVSGPSKAGKSRTLFAAASAVLPDAVLIAPSNAASLSDLLKPGGLPTLEPGPVVVWLDDLEDFVRIGEGMGPRVLEHLRAWNRPVLVLATFGGKGQRRLSEAERGQFVDQTRELLHFATVTPLFGELSEREQGAARALYSDETVSQMAHGIGEYMIAASELEQKLITGRHDGGPDCPEGVAVTWAAIDWQRVGMTDPISEQLLKELYANYLTGFEPTEERFRRGLEWARRPLYSSVALVSPVGSIRPYDHIVAYADRELGREVNERSWDRVIEVVEDADAIGLGLMAYVRDSVERAERAWTRAAQSDDAAVAGPAASNLGALLQQRGDLEGAETAYRRGDERGYGTAASNLGVLLQQRGDLEGAEAAYRRGDERGHGAAAAGVGVLLAQRGDLEGAEAAWRRGDERGDGAAASNLGALLQLRGDLEGAEAALE